jgi:hypothetical protein
MPSNGNIFPAKNADEKRLYIPKKAITGAQNIHNFANIKPP